MHHRAAEGAIVAQIRIPHAIERREARRGERFVDRRPAPDPGEAPRDPLRIPGEALGKFRIEQVRLERARAVMQERHDRYAAFAQALQARRRPLEIAVLPKQRKARRSDAEIGDRIDVGAARPKARLPALIARGRRIDPSDARLGRRPDFDHSLRSEPARAASRATSQGRSCGRRACRRQARAGTRRRGRTLRRRHRACGSTRR